MSKMSQQQAQKSLRDSLYLVENPQEESTFKYDEDLPRLPVPTVKETIFKLLDTIKPIAPDESSFRETEKKAIDFIQDSQVNELQELLLKRSENYKNWLEEWWLEFAYLRSRKPLIPYSNMAAPLPIMDYWPLVERNSPAYSKIRIKRASLSTYFQLNFWKMLREERMRPMIHKGVPWSMAQFRFLFNTVRRPGEPKDELVSWFNLAKDGSPASTEIIVLHKGYIFAIKPVIIDGRDVEILAPPEIERQLDFIEKYCLTRPYGPGVGCLTTMERTDWTEARQKLFNTSQLNQSLLERIDKALSVLILDESEPTEANDIFRLSMCGDARNRWADKSISSIAFKNGTFGANADHTPYDGFCTAIMTHYLMTSIEECQGVWSDLRPAESGRFVQPELLDFQLSVQVKNLINDALVQFEKVTTTIDTLHKTFGHFGKAIMKQHRFHPEAFIQVAIHSTYLRLHKKMAPAYVTASTRRFYNGRTETCRSCYPEMRQFSEHLIENKSSKPRETYEKLKLAVHKFQALMNEASNGHGCDRHLMGLYLIAILEGKKIPELFDDELLLKTNNYILSTSCGGYWNVCGGVPPLVEEGYGCFYGIEDDAITFCLTAYNTCQTTDLKLFYKQLESTLLEMQEVLILTSKL